MYPKAAIKLLYSNTTKVSICPYFLGPDIAQCFIVTFAGQPPVLCIDECKQKWAVLIGAIVLILKIV